MCGTVCIATKNEFVTDALRQFVRSWLVFALAAVVGCGGAYSPNGGGNPPPAPSITSLNPTSGVAGTSVTITGTYFGATQGASTVKFNGTAAAPTSWSATSIVVPVPAGATTGNVVVTVGGVASNGVNFAMTAPAPSITSLNPTSGLVGTSVTIAGANFGATQGTSTVKFNGTTGTPTSWSATSIVVPVPTGATTGHVVVTVGGVASNGVSFTVTAPAPSITSLNPTSGVVGTSVTITGANFGATQGTSTVTFNGTTATPTSWSATSIVVRVPVGATTGNVVVMVGGVASNGVGFTVVADTTAPVVNITAPANGATVSATITLTATATDPDSAVSFVQFQVDGANTGAQLTTAPYSISLDTTTLSNATHTLTAVAQDPSGNKGTSSAVMITVSNTTNPPMGPLKKSTMNTRYFVDPAGNAVFLSGSHTWNDVQDTSQSSSPAAFPFANYVSMLKADGQNATILWRKDMPRECGWNSSTWNLQPQPWLRSTTSGASDGGNKFDLTQFNQQFFDRMHSEALTLQQNGIYAIVELFDGSNVAGYRCGTISPNGDGYPLTSVNNINGVDDGYVSGSGGEGSFIMQTNNAVSNAEDAYVKKMLDTMNDLQNVVYELAEEQPIETSTFWIPHMYGLIKTYEAGGTWEGTTYPGKLLQHLVGVGAFSCSGNDPTLYASNVDWIAPTVTACNAAFPSNVAANNQGKIVINDSDHALGFAAFVNSSTGAINDALLRGYIWENITSGAAGVIFMDPYIVSWTTGQRNPCSSPSSGICPAPMTKYDPFRQAMGLAQGYVNAKMDLLKATPQGSLSSTGFCLADNAATGAEFLVYAPNGGTFTVNLSATTRMLNVEWFNPATGVPTSGGTVTGGNTAQPFPPPFGGDAVLYIVDAAGHN